MLTHAQANVVEQMAGDIRRLWDEQTERMKPFLARAIQDRSVQVNGKPLSEHHLGIVLAASLSIGSDGFDSWTLWRALALATEERAKAHGENG